MIDRATRALSLFEELVELAANERERALTALQRDDPALHAAVVALLQSNRRAPTRPDRSSGQPLTDPSAPAEADADEAPADPSSGTRLGAWRIDRLLARGGLGNVYEAHRDDGQYQQRIALKRLRIELASDELIAAFRDERTHLARLDHPGIAPLIDGGVDENGQPWFAMRCIDGVAIDHWCDQRLASIRDRVGLLIQVAQALAYVHAQGLLHRDLKPSKVLVTQDGQVHLIGFGLSSRFEAMAGGQVAAIAPPWNHAAPEIRAGAPGGIAADLYALGVLTYRLLSAQWPTPTQAQNAPTGRMRNGAAASMDHLLIQASESVAHQRGLRNLGALMRALAGDLSAIALKATAIQPQDRYSSAHEFAEDLRRWSEHRPVDANPIGPWARLRKQLRRNRVAATLGTIVLLSLITGTSYSLWQYRIANSHHQATRAISQLFASTLGTATLSGLGSAPFSSQALLAKTETQLRKLDLRDQPAVLARGLAMLARSYAVIGDYRHAELLADQAQQTLGAEADSDGYIAATRLSMLNNRARYGEAAQLAQTRLAELADRHDAQAHQTKVNFNVELALAQWGLGETTAALNTLDTASKQALALGNDHQELLAQLLIQRSAFRARMYRLKDAKADLEQAIGLAEGHNEILADDARERLLSMLASYHRTSDLALAERLLRDRRASLGDHHPKTGRAWLLLGYAQFMSGEKVVAQQTMEAGQKLIEAAYGRQHPEYALSLQMLSTIAARESRDNVEPLREALRISQSTLGPRHETTLYLRRVLAMRLPDLPPDILKPSDLNEAEALFTQNIRIKREAGIPAPWEKLMLGYLLLYRGEAEDLRRADVLLNDSRLDAQRYFEPKDTYSAMAHLFWSGLLYQQGHRAAADREFAGIIETYRDDHSYRAQLYLRDSLMYRSVYAYENCNQAQAETYLKQALTSERDRLGADHFVTRDTANFLGNLQKHGRLFSTTGAQVPPKRILDTADLRAQMCVRRRAR